METTFAILGALADLADVLGVSGLTVLLGYRTWKRRQSAADGRSEQTAFLDADGA